MATKKTVTKKKYPHEVRHEKMVAFSAKGFKAMKDALKPFADDVKVELKEAKADLKKAIAEAKKAKLMTSEMSDGSYRTFLTDSQELRVMKRKLQVLDERVEDLSDRLQCFIPSFDKRDGEINIDLFELPSTFRHVETKLTNEALNRDDAAKIAQCMPKKKR